MAKGQKRSNKEVPKTEAGQEDVASRKRGGGQRVTDQDYRDCGLFQQEEKIDCDRNIRAKDKR